MNVVLGLRVDFVHMLVMEHSFDQGVLKVVVSMKHSDWYKYHVYLAH